MLLDEYEELYRSQTNAAALLRSQGLIEGRKTQPITRLAEIA